MVKCRVKRELKEEVELIQRQIIDIEQEVEQQGLNIANVDRIVNSLRKLTDDILQSQAYIKTY